MKMMIHFGTQKTGSTSIQKYLQINHQVFEQQGIKIGNAFGKMLSFAPGLVPLMRTGSIAQIRESLAPFSERLRQEVNGPYDSLFFSNENLYPLNSFPLQSLVFIREYLQSLSDSPIQIIPLLYVRRQDEAVVSLYQQYIRGGKITKTLEAYADKRAGSDYFNYLKNIQVLEQAFECVHIKVYDDEVKNGGLIPGLIRYLGVTDEQALSPIDHQNQALEAHVVEVMRRFAQAYPDRPRAEINKAFKWLRNIPGNNSLDLPLQQKSQIMDEHFKNNLALIKRYSLDENSALLDPSRKTGLVRDELNPSVIDYLLEHLDAPEMNGAEKPSNLE